MALGMKLDHSRKPGVCRTCQGTRSCGHGLSTLCLTHAAGWVPRPGCCSELGTTLCSLEGTPIPPEWAQRRVGEGCKGAGWGLALEADMHAGGAAWRQRARLQARIFWATPLSAAPEIVLSSQVLGSSWVK